MKIFIYLYVQNAWILALEANKQKLPKHSLYPQMIIPPHLLHFVTGSG